MFDDDQLDLLEGPLPLHPTLTVAGRPVRALGRTRSGCLVWPVRGGADDQGDTGADDGTSDDDDGSDDDDDQGDTGQQDDNDRQLGPAGEKALAAEKAKRRAAQQQLRQWRALGTPEQVKAALDALKTSGSDKQQPDVEQIRAEARAQAQTEALHARVADKIEAKAGGRFALDTEDVAVMLLRRHDVEDFIDDGKVDVDAITEALNDLLSKNPGLAAQSGKRFKGDADGGARKESKPKPKSLQEAITARIAAG